MEKEYRKPSIVPLKDRPLDEQQAIQDYLDHAHPSNLPKNVDKGTWDFRSITDKTHRRYGHLNAGLFVGYAI